MNRTRVETVLRVRELQERLARQEVVRERHALARREQAENEARQLVARHAESTVGPMAGSRLLDRRHMLSSGVVRTQRLSAAVVDASHDVDRAMSSWQERAERLDGIERLAERVAEHDREESARAENALIDDLVIARWQTGGDPVVEVAR